MCDFQNQQILVILNQLIECEILVTAYIIRGSLVAYQIGYIVVKCPRRQFQTLISQIMQINSNFKEFEKLSVEKKTLSQLNDLGSNLSAVEASFIPQKDFQIL